VNHPLEASRKLAIALALRERIYAGRIPPGGRLPTVRECAKEYGAAPNTVVAAYELLREWGIAESDGSGSRSRRRREGEVAGPVERLARMAAGLSPLSPGESSRIDEAGLLVPEAVPPRVLDALCLEAGAVAARRSGVVLAGDGTVVELTVVWHPEDVARAAPAVLEPAPVADGGTVKALERAGFPIERAGWHTVRPAEADGYVARSLGVAAGEIVLTVFCTRTVKSGRPVEYLEQYYPGSLRLHW
jgi:GntR family transcriptional regulator